MKTKYPPLNQEKATPGQAKMSVSGRFCLVFGSTWAKCRKKRKKVVQNGYPFFFKCEKVKTKSKSMNWIILLRKINTFKNDFYSCWAGKEEIHVCKRRKRKMSKSGQPEVDICETRFRVWLVYLLREGQNEITIFKMCERVEIAIWETENLKHRKPKSFLLLRKSLLTSFLLK